MALGLRCKATLQEARREFEQAADAMGQWRSQTTFVIATVGAAVGLGNVWRFSYVAGENGKAMFLLVYLVAILLIALQLILAEAAIGRHSQGVASRNRERIWISAGALGVISACLSTL